MRSFLLLSAFFIACSSTTTGDDGGTPDGSSPDSSTKDGSATDGSPSDGSATDGSPSDGGGGKLDAGDTCDLNDDQCGPGLKCCHGGATTLDGGNTGSCIPPTDAGTCPLVP